VSAPSDPIITSVKLLSYAGGITSAFVGRATDGNLMLPPPIARRITGPVPAASIAPAVPCISIPTCSYPAIFVCTPTTITCITMTCSALYVLYGSPMLTCPAPFVPPPIAPCMSDLALTMLYV